MSENMDLHKKISSLDEIILDLAALENTLNTLIQENKNTRTLL